MLEDRPIAALLAIVLLAVPAWAQSFDSRQTMRGSAPLRAEGTAQSLSSPSVAGRFREIAYELAHAEGVGGPEIDQAMILLTAAKSLRLESGDIEALLLKLAVRRTDRDYSRQIVLWLQDYVGASADRTIVMDAVRYLLDRLNSREERQALLEQLVSRIGNKNPAIDSELATQLGLFMLEKGDSEAAKFYLVQAYANNKYNKVAFARLAELAPKEIGAASYLEHLRLILRENPVNITSAMGFSQYTERLQLYEVATQSYQYCAALFRYLYPTEPLPPHIYLPWAISSYNAPDGLSTCLQIAENVRQTGRFDLLLEAIAGKAAARMGNTHEAQRILRQTEQRAQQLLEPGPGQPPASGGITPVRELSPKQLAWFYCFADANPAKAVEWANKAFSVEPNSPSAASLLAYALSISNQLEWAKPLVQASESSQISDLVKAKIELTAGDRKKAMQTLTMAIAKDASSLAAEKAKDMLRELGAEYTPPANTDMLLTFLRENVGRTVVPQFVPPDKMMDVQLSIRGSDFSYGAELEGVVAIINRGSEPLVITPDGLFQGGIRISAQVTGDIRKEIPNLVSRTMRTDLTLAPGRSLVHLVKLSTGELRRLLMTYPQATLNIQFTLYLDPVVAADGSVSNRLVDLKPAAVSVTRPGVSITAGYVRNRFNAISSGQEGQKIQTAQLFTGLLKEQYAMAEHGTLYAFKYAEWLPNLLRSALLADSGLLLAGGQGEWVVKVHTMADMLSMPVDQELASVVAKSLNHPAWPVRLMAVYLLANNSGGDFGRVLDWVAENDTSELVRSIATSLRFASGSDTASARLSPVTAPFHTRPR